MLKCATSASLNQSEKREQKTRIETVEQNIHRTYKIHYSNEEYIRTQPYGVSSVVICLKKSMKNPFTIFHLIPKLFTIMWFICLCDEICTIYSKHPVLHVYLL